MKRDQSQGFSSETITPQALDVASWVRGTPLSSAHSFPFAVVDGALKTFAASQVQPSTNVLVQRYDQNMNLEWEGEIALPAGFRSSGQAITGQGMLIAYLHSPTEVCVPHFYGPLPGFTAVVQGGGGPPPPGPPPPPPPGPPPPAPVVDVAAIARAVVDLFVAESSHGGPPLNHSLYNLVQAGVSTQIDAKGVLTTANFAAQIIGHLDSYFRDRGYEADVQAELHEPPAPGPGPAP